VLSGDVVDEDDAPQEGWLLRLDRDGDVVAEQFFGGRFDQYCYDVIPQFGKGEGGAGYILLCDMDHREAGDTDAVSLRSFDADGALLREGIVSNAGDDTAFRLFGAPGGDIIVLGTTTSRPGTPDETGLSDVADDYNIWLFRVDGNFLNK